MRIYANPYELISESFRDVFEMGHIIKPKSMQNKAIDGNDDFITKEINNYSYCLLRIPEDQEKWLFITDPQSEAWTKAELAERVMNPYTFKNPGEAWKLRKDIWEQFLNQNSGFDYAYNERLNSFMAIDRVIKRIKEDPDSRQLIITVWNPVDIINIGGEARVPCTLNYQILVRNNMVHIIYNQRSADVVTHFGNDVWLAYNLMKYITDKVNNSIPADQHKYHYGYLYHNIGSLHSYKKDWNVLKTCIGKLK